MKKAFLLYPLFTLLIATTFSCKNKTTTTAEPSFATVRKTFAAKLTKQTGAKGEVEAPPADLFAIVQYPTAIGNMAAYLSNIPNDGQLHPAMIWITGGFGNDISDVWSEQEPDNDQSAGVIRKAGVVMMYPSQRGGNTNAGADETCFGEVEDIMAAATYLAKQKGIDPKRIYLGGHSTGGTKVLLVAESSNQFRAVFCLGAVAAVQDYGDDFFTFDAKNPKEFEMREPIRWLSSLQTPTFIFEGTGGNIASLKQIKAQSEKEENKFTHFYEVKNKDHFSAIQPVTKLIATKIMSDNKDGAVAMDFDTDVKGIQ